MPVKGIDQVNRRIKSTLNNIAGNISKKTMLTVLNTGMNHAVLITPVGDTSNLINNRSVSVNETANGLQGYALFFADYAKYVHDGGPKNWQRLGAEDAFLYKGFEENIPELRQIIINGYKI